VRIPCGATRDEEIKGVLRLRMTVLSDGHAPLRMTRLLMQGADGLGLGFVGGVAYGVAGED
jgi:hypothetical protein